jgi:hypothetical protein
MLRRLVGLQRPDELHRVADSGRGAKVTVPALIYGGSRGPGRPVRTPDDPGSDPATPTQARMSTTLHG